MAISEAAARLEALCQSLLEGADDAAAGGRETMASLVAAVREAAAQDTD